MTQFHNLTSYLRCLTRKHAYLWVACILCLATATSLAIWNFKTREDLKKIHEVRTKLALILPEEKEDLEYLFRHLMFYTSFAYVLFGDKPMSFDNFIQTDHVWKHFMHSFTCFEQGLDYCKYQQGWAVWEKYKHLFPLKKFILVQQKHFDFSGYTDILFINNKNFLKTMSKYSTDFKKVLGDDFNPNKILASFSKPVYTLHLKLNRHSALLGILLGYGKENSWYYYKLWRLRVRAKKDPAAVEELNSARALFMKFSDLPNHHIGYPINLPMFMCVPKSKETLSLMKKYSRQRIDIYKKYQKADFLEVTLLKLTEE